MRFRMVFAFSVAVLLMLGSAVLAQEPEQERWGWCRPDGSWIGSSPTWGSSWLIEYQSVNRWEGSFTLRFVGGDPSAGGAFPVESQSIAVGSWIRTGGRSFDYTMVYYGLAAGGQEPVVLIKLTGEVVIADDCQTLDVYNEWYSIYHPTQDPFGTDDPLYGCFPDSGVSPARRVPVQGSCMSDIP